MRERLPRRSDWPLRVMVVGVVLVFWVSLAGLVGVLCLDWGCDVVPQTLCRLISIRRCYWGRSVVLSLIRALQLRAAND